MEVLPVYQRASGGNARGQILDLDITSHEECLTNKTLLLCPWRDGGVDRVFRPLAPDGSERLVGLV